MAFIVDEDVQLNAGSATALSLQYLINLSKLSPVTTPGGTIPCNPGIFGFVMFYEYFENLRIRVDVQSCNQNINLLLIQNTILVDEKLFMFISFPYP